jgi:hypothetical protein
MEGGPLEAKGHVFYYNEEDKYILAPEPTGVRLSATNFLPLPCSVRETLFQDATCPSENYPLEIY